MAIAFSKLQYFVQDLAQKLHNLNADTFFVCLTNSITPSTSHVLTDLTQVTGTGYTAGGMSAGAGTCTQSGGTASFTVATTSGTWTAGASDWGAVRYLAIYNNTATNKNLIGYWDYGSSFTPINTDTISWSLASGVLTIA